MLISCAAAALAGAGLRKVVLCACAERLANLRQAGAPPRAKRAGVRPLAIIAALNHVTHYAYDRPVTLGPQIIRLRPAPHCRAAIKSYSLKVTPAEHFVNWQQDPERQLAGALRLSGAGEGIPDRGRSHHRALDHQPVRLLRRDRRRGLPLRLPRRAARGAGALSRHRAAGRAADALSARDLPREETNTVNFIVDLNAQLAQHVAYGIRMEPGVQEPEHTLAVRSGSCRDTSWLLVQILRHLGLAARFVSGYLIQMKADIAPLEGPARHRQGFHRPARLGRGLYSRRGLDRARPHLRPADRRGPSAAGGDAALPLGRAGLRRRQLCRDHLRLPDERGARARGAAHHPALLRRVLDASSMRWASGSRPISRRRMSG